MATSLAQKRPSKSTSSKSTGPAPTSTSPFIDKKLGTNIDLMYAARESVRLYEAKIKEIKEEITAIEEAIIAQLKDLGLDQAKGSKASVSVSKKDVANVVDWDKLYTYIGRQKAFHRLQRRVSEAAWREEVESRKGKSLPGVEAFSKTSLNLRSL